MVGIVSFENIFILMVRINSFVQYLCDNSKSEVVRSYYCIPKSSLQYCYFVAVSPVTGYGRIECHMS